VSGLPKVALVSASAGIEPATSNRTSNAQTTVPPSHTTARPIVTTITVMIADFLLKQLCTTAYITISLDYC